MPVTTPSLIIRGRIETANEQVINFANYRAELWKYKSRDKKPLAVTSIKQDGRFAFRFLGEEAKKLQADNALTLYFKIYSGSILLANTESGDEELHWTDKVRDEELVVLLPPVELGRVYGKIYTSKRVGAPNLKIKVMDVGLADDKVQIAEAVTDEKGAYDVQFLFDKILKRGKQNADIQLLVVDPKDNKKSIPSDLRFNAKREEEFNFILPKDSIPEPCECELLQSKISPHIKGTPLRNLQENGKRKDITYLARKTGWDARLIAMAALADDFSEKSKAKAVGKGKGAAPAIPADLYYALFRAGVPTGIDRIYQTNARQVEAIWNKAIEQNIISDTHKKSIPQYLKQFKTVSAKHILKEAKTIGVSSMNEMLSSTLKKESDKEAFVEMYYHREDGGKDFWQQLKDLPQFGPEISAQLQLDGKLGFLTINNAPLITKLRDDKLITNDPVELVRKGLYESESWDKLLANGIEIPADIPGDGAEKRRNYASLMATQLKLSYPTMVLGERINSDELKLKLTVEKLKGKEGAIKDSVYKFLHDYQAEFTIGKQPFEQFLKDKKIRLDGDDQINKEAIAQLKRMQRVYQVSPSDEAMKVLLDNDFDSAYSIVKYPEKAFIESYTKLRQNNALVFTAPRAAVAIGKGSVKALEQEATLIYAKAHQIRSIVMNVATAYITYKANPPLYVMSEFYHPPQDPKNDFISNVKFPDQFEISEFYKYWGNRPKPEVIAYPTLEELFGEMDFCECEHCRSVLSPVAYLVELLQFIDREGSGEIPAGKKNPIDVLLGKINPNNPNDPNNIRGKRPDIQHIQLTCENTNTVLPYIDLVNEVLEHYVIHDSLDNFKGFNMDSNDTTEELLANPQFVDDAAYNILKGKVYPLTLPFNQPLEALRLYYSKMKVPLYEAMEKLRKHDGLDSDAPYGWRDIYLEYLGMSREEYAILTETKDVAVYYGEAAGTDLNALFSADNTYAKVFSRKVGITYKELVAIVKTQFINPGSHLIPKMERLYMGLPTIIAFLNGGISNADFDNLLPEMTDELIENKYGGDVKQWLRDNKAAINSLILLIVPTGSLDDCSFVQLQLSYADNSLLKEIDYFKLMRFIRLWKKLGWTIEETDKALTALFKLGDNGSDIEKLNDGFKAFIIKLAHLQKVMEKLKLKRKRDLEKALALWSLIDLQGDKSLYRQLFLNATILKLDNVFEEDGYNNYLQDNNQKVIGHRQALQAAFNLVPEDFDRLFAELSLDDQSPLNLENCSLMFRYAFLARALKLSVQELLILKKLSGIDPFHELENIQPSTLRFIERAQIIKEAGFKIPNLTYFLQHEDLSGKASPKGEDVLAFAKTLRTGLKTIEDEHKVEDDPTGEITKAKMALVYGEDIATQFFGLLNGPQRFEVDYSSTQPNLSQEIRDTSPKIAYDHGEKKLSFNGAMTRQERDALLAVGSPGFINALHGLFYTCQIGYGATDAKYKVEYTHSADELGQAIKDTSSKVTYDKTAVGNYLVFWGYMTPTERTALEGVAPNAAFQTAIGELYNEIQLVFGAYHHLLFEKYPDLIDLYNGYINSDETDTEKIKMLPNAFLPFLKRQLKLLFIRQTLSAELGTALTNLIPLIEDQQILQAVGQADQPLLFDITQLERKEGNPMELGDILINRTWRLYLEAPSKKAFDFFIHTNGDNVVLRIDGEEVLLAENNGVWTSRATKELDAGKLYLVEITVENASGQLAIQWQSQGIAKEDISATTIYPYSVIQNFRQSYLRLIKAVSLLDELKLHDHEISHLGQVMLDDTGEGWLKSIPAASDPAFDPKPLFDEVVLLMRYALAKKDLKIKDDALIEVFENPDIIDESGEKLLPKLTRWDTASVETLRQDFDITQLDQFLRLKEAMDVVGTIGVTAADLQLWTTNRPTGDTVRQLQAALRAKYDQAGWLKILQPINDELRNRQRDALVAFVLSQLSKDPDTAHINTPNKLFEYFLIDVEMDACMKTSRIKQALSSVQLFIHRCLLNLEPSVSPSSIKAQQWEWMKRYRVWEANRKVFLYPENWLDPELRDNKSSFFKDFESELLQSDITEDTAHVALLHYLEKLDEIAKLEICGMYLQENDIKKGGKYYDADDILHVFGRTPGANRKYYYRRLEPGGSWTPWEKVDLDIEDNPILPVVWKNRLFLFWLSILTKGESEDQNTPLSAGSEDRLDSVRVDEIKTDTRVKVEATLSWSEYYNDKWQPRRTSDIDNPMVLNSYRPGEFDRKSMIQMSSLEHGNDSLFIRVNDLYFRFYNKHSLPENSTIGRYFYFYALERGVLPGLAGEFAGEIYGALTNPSHLDNAKQFWEEHIEPFTVNFPLFNQFPTVRKLVIDRTSFSAQYPLPGFEALNSTVLSNNFPIQHTILENSNGLQSVFPKHFSYNFFETPFFLQDNRHVFFIRPYKRPQSIIKVVDGGIFIPAPVAPTPGYVLVDNPYIEVWQQPDERIPPEIIVDVLTEGPQVFDPDTGVINPDPLEGRFISSIIDNAVLTTDTMQFVNVLVSAAGGVTNLDILSNPIIFRKIKNNLL